MMNDETRPQHHQTSGIDHQGDDGSPPHDDDGVGGAAAAAATSGVVDAGGAAMDGRSSATSDARPRFCGDCL